MELKVKNTSANTLEYSAKHDETHETLHAKELALKSAYNFDSYKDELKFLEDNLPEDMAIRKGLIKEINEAKKLIEEHEFKSENNTSTFDKILSKALSIAFNNEYRPNKPLIDHQMSKQKKCHKTAVELQALNHKLMLANKDFANYVSANGYDMHKINRDIAKNSINDEVTRFKNDREAIALMDRQATAAQDLIDATQSDAMGSLLTNLNNSSFSTDFNNMLETEVENVLSVKDKLADSPIIDGNTMKELQEKIDEMIENITSFIDGLFNRNSNTMAP